MKTIRKVSVTHEYVKGFMPDFDTFEERRIYISIDYKTAIHKCLCGCGEKVVTPLDKYGWKISEYQKGNLKLTMTPSIGNFQLPCKSHYIITNGMANFV